MRELMRGLMINCAATALFIKRPPARPPTPSQSRFPMSNSVYLGMLYDTSWKTTAWIQSNSLCPTCPLLSHRGVFALCQQADGHIAPLITMTPTGSISVIFNVNGTGPSDRLCLPFYRLVSARLVSQILNGLSVVQRKHANPSKSQSRPLIWRRSIKVLWKDRFNG